MPGTITPLKWSLVPPDYKECCKRYLRNYSNFNKKKVPPVRDGPFNFQGGNGFFQKNILIPKVAEKNILILGGGKKI